MLICFHLFNPQDIICPGFNMLTEQNTGPIVVSSSKARNHMWKSYGLEEKVDWFPHVLVFLGGPNFHPNSCKTESGSPGSEHPLNPQNVPTEGYFFLLISWKVMFISTIIYGQSQLNL